MIAPITNILGPHKTPEQASLCILVILLDFFNLLNYYVVVASGYHVLFRCVPYWILDGLLSHLSPFHTYRTLVLKIVLHFYLFFLAHETHEDWAVWLVHNHELHRTISPFQLY